MMGEVIRVTGRAPDVGDLLREAMASRRFADVTLCCSGGHRFLAHRLVLSAASPYLQKVLLGHGRSAGNCEPITIILAEVEAPELAAILSFVYTGSATLPRCRFHAFARAAETLHVRIVPPTLMPMIENPNPHYIRSLDRSIDDCNRDNVKIEETTMDSSYLRCDQYPSYEKCYLNSTSCDYENYLERLRQSEFTSKPNDRQSETIERLVNDRSRNLQYRENFANPKIFHNDNKDDEKSLEFRGSVDGCFTRVSPIADFFVTKDRSSKTESWEFEVGDRGHDDGTVCGVDRDTRSDRFHGFDDSVSRTSGWTIASCQREIGSAGSRRQAEDRLDDNDFEGGSIGKGRRGLALVHDRTEIGRSGVTFEKRDYDAATGGDRSLEADVPTSAVDAVAGTSSATVTSGIVTDETVNRVTDCPDNCFRWRSTRRHVANRVPASPWCQLARPAHNSPKIRTNVRRNREEISESVRHRWDESNPIQTIKPTSEHYVPPTTIFNDHSREPELSSVPLNLHNDITRDDSYILTVRQYDFQVPKTTMEITSSIDPITPVFNDSQPRTDFYDPTIYEPSIRPIFPQTTIPPERYSENSRINVIVDDIDAGEKKSSAVDFSYENTNNVGLRTMLEAAASTNANDAPGVKDRHAIAITNDNQRRIVDDSLTRNSRTSPRIELSHPISRLCDSASFNDDNHGDRDETRNDRGGAVAIVETVVMSVDEETVIVEKPILPVDEEIVVNSDSNNNEAAIDGSTVSRNLIDSTEDGTDSRILTNECPAISEDHRCDQCGKTFVTRASLKVHGRTHSGEKPFRCNDCGKEFSQLRNYKYHRSIHEGTREFAATCPECGKYFNDRGYLSSHMKIHRNRKEYACADCGKSFNQRVAYNMHVRIHTGVKPHQCDQCGKAFSRKMLLKQHLRTHSGERPYQCQICHKAFADRSNMTLHTRLHSGLKPYQCTLCSKAFTKKHHLKTHLNYHTGTKPYSCPNCNLRFSQSSNMRTHYKKCLSTGNVNVSYQCVNDDNEMKTIDRANKTNVRNRASGSNSGRTNALTPPSSDHESSIHTSSMSDDISCQINRNYSTRTLKPTENSVTDI